MKIKEQKSQNRYFKQTNKNITKTNNQNMKVFITRKIQPIAKELLTKEGFEVSVFWDLLMKKI